MWNITNIDGSLFAWQKTILQHHVYVFQNYSALFWRQEEVQTIIRNICLLLSYLQVLLLFTNSAACQNRQ